MLSSELSTKAEKDYKFIFDYFATETGGTEKLKLRAINLDRPAYKGLSPAAITKAEEDGYIRVRKNSKGERILKLTKSGIEFVGNDWKTDLTAPKHEPILDVKLPATRDRIVDQAEETRPRLHGSLRGWFP